MGFAHVMTKLGMPVTDNSYLPEEFDEAAYEMRIRILRAINVKRCKRGLSVADLFLPAGGIDQNVVIKSY